MINRNQIDKHDLFPRKEFIIEIYLKILGLDRAAEDLRLLKKTYRARFKILGSDTFGVLAGVGLCAAALSGCNFQDKSESSKPYSAFDDDKFTSDRGFYIHIKADLEVTKTGENLNFDYVISCYNREVRGSFSGILKPKIMFKATATGEAVAIVPPEHYCERGLRGYALERPGDSMVIPQVTWYPDVNDLSFAISYMSDSAYRNPNAHLKFKSYSYARSNKAAFVKSTDRLEASYEQIGAIPGPFGCADEDVNSDSDEYACSHITKLRRNGGHNIIIYDEKYTDRHVRVYEVPQKLIAAIRRLPDGKTRYYCVGGRTNDERSSIPQLNVHFIKRGRGKTAFSDEEKDLIKEFTNSYTPYYNQFLSWDVVENNSGNVALRNKPVEELYPVISYGPWNYYDFTKTPKNAEKPDYKYDYYVQPNKDKLLRPRLINVLYEPRWKGFSIASRRAITDHLPELAVNLDSFDPDFTTPKQLRAGGVLINGQLACLGAHSPPGAIYDLEKALFFRIQR